MYMSDWKKWKQELTALGGWDNELIQIPAGAVKKIILRGEEQEDVLANSQQENERLRSCIEKMRAALLKANWNEFDSAYKEAIGEKR